MAEPSITGYELFNVLEPILDEGSTNGATFLQRMATAITTYIASNYVFEGVYTGVIPGTPPSPSSLTVAIAMPTTISSSFVEFTEAMHYNYATWIKQSLESTLKWQIVPTDSQHSFTTTQMIRPVLQIIDGLGNLSSLSTAKGFWSLISDAIICAILSDTNRLLPVGATAIDGSNGEIIWITLDIPELKHDFIFRVKYDQNNQALIQWIESHTYEQEPTGYVNVQISNKTYQNALSSWNELKSMTKDCEYYKKQGDDKKILLTTGSQI